ncbi:MAG: hypothetical protein Unbinned92contig1003_27 [Prokaryotic dsDNA virus sp.]|jgi:rRNA maturation endonuclease Nob1|nr:MAG: hypothetical protein Unbinned92contig1003_27 [Prokaryotic dsDNA virus sp.]|tara:strand:+ start:10358 stop:10585 length:228 start_codon:yes stop_codon:yes gene_type:complete
MKKVKLKKKAYNYLIAVGKRIMGGFENVSDIVYSERIEICVECTKLNPKYECSICGCPVETKAAWKTESCPEKKW